MNNSITMRGGDDVLNPGLGIDWVWGGAGVDTLILDYSQGDGATTGGTVYESSYLVRRDTVTNAVIDQIYAGEFEKFQFMGSSKGDEFAGWSYDDIIRGMGGNDRIRGGGGKDTMDGGAGIDTLDYSDIFVAVAVTLNGATQVTATVNGVAEDLVRNFERVTGGYGHDTLAGDALANWLAGGFGLDTLTGGGGADRFIFTSLSNGADTITDFSSADDTIAVSATGFGGGLVAGTAAKLTTVTDFTTVTSVSARFIYDTDGADQGLYFDADGGSGANAVLFARLNGLPSLVAGDILLI